MSKNKIIPQMFDVRPVDETGDLDWKKIQSIGDFAACAGDDPTSEERIFQSEFCVGDESGNISFAEAQFFEQDFLAEEREAMRKDSEQRLLAEKNRKELEIKAEEERIENQRIKKERITAERNRQQRILLAEKDKKDQQRVLFLEAEKKRLEAQQREVMEKINKIHKEKEAVIVAQKAHEQNARQEFIRQQAVEKRNELKRIADQNRQKHEEYETAVLEERQNRERQHAEWLEKEMQEEARAQKLQQAIAEKIEKADRKKESRTRSSLKKNNSEDFSWRELLFPSSFKFQFDLNSSLMNFAVISLVVFLGVGSVAYASKGFGMKGKVLGASTDGLANLNLAMNAVAHQNFEESTQKFDKALADFSDGSDQLNSMGGLLLDATRFVPFASKVSSGKNAVEAGQHFAAAGKSLNEVAKIAAKFKNPLASSAQSEFSLLDFFDVAQKNIGKAKIELDGAQKNIDLVSIDDLPSQNQGKFLLVKQKLPDLRNALDLFLNNSHILADLLGANGPRKYLFLFQNNAEMRATGGFIGSYGLLDIANGHVKKFFIDGIFNPDGQLKDKIVPPVPIQKISAAWSLHDSNWFADFPLSARKAISFYEKTGGPTADGVISITPTVMQKLLEITGPIEMPEYGVTLDSKNFIELTQFKVEVDYDKQENKPKKILSDLAPIVLEKLLNSKDLITISKTAQAFFDGLGEKQILFYSENTELQKIISTQGWSGEIISTPKDYISVVNTNVNGFKTDAIVEESINHSAQIQSDGSIVDTVSITRKHNGGNSSYDWLNKVNADYMRVYVPEGSKLLEVSGQTREFDQPPVNYNALGFKRDSDVQNEENNMKIDEPSGTRVYQEFGKTVFANWTYVSPQETMTITYKYLLPFSLFKVSVADKLQADSYSLVAQKQSGSFGSKFSSKISYPSDYQIKWNFPTDGEKTNNEFKDNDSLKTDKFEGLVFEKK